jgi:hypothetical protein
LDIRTDHGDVASGKGDRGLFSHAQLTPRIEITLDEQRQLISTFTTISASSPAEEADLPDFALSAVGDLPITLTEGDGPSPAETLMTISTSASSSLASPPAQDARPGPGAGAYPSNIFVFGDVGLYGPQRQETALPSDLKHSLGSPVFHQQSQYSSPDKSGFDGLSEWVMNMHSPVF